MTSPFSIYILIGLTYPDYKAEPFATYIDSGSGICLSKLACLLMNIKQIYLQFKEKTFQIKILFLPKELNILEFLLTNILSNYLFFIFIILDVIFYLEIIFCNSLKLLFKKIFPTTFDSKLHVIIGSLLLD